MTARLVRRARKVALTPDQQQKVEEIKAALAQSDVDIGDAFISFNTFRAYAYHHPVTRLGVLGTQLESLGRFHSRLLQLAIRLDKLHTGLRAERLLRDAAVESAAAVYIWRQALASTDPGYVDAAIGRMNSHFTKADKLGKAGAAALKLGQ